MKTIVVAFGTRPEAIKLVPVINALSAAPNVDTRVLLTGQHREQLDMVLSAFAIPVDADLNVMTERQRLPELVAQIVPRTSEQLRGLSADFVIVQGDTLTTFCVSLAAFFEGVPIAHVEAGLRTGTLREPFPEEASRRLTAVITDLHLAPTPQAKMNLLQEGVRGDGIVVTGQTAVDAIRLAANHANAVLPAGIPADRLVTVTLHRRENWPRLADLARTLARLAGEHRTHTFVFPVHLNPVVREAVFPVLRGVSNFRLIDPLDYFSMAALLSHSALVITDSGGIQEEAVTLGVPVAVIRNVTERPEGVTTGGIVLAGNDPERAYRVIRELLQKARGRASSAANPYGDGRAGDRVAQAVIWRLGLGDRPEDWNPIGRSRAGVAL